MKTFNHSEATAKIELEESKGFKVRVIETELPEKDSYVGYALGTFKIIPFTNGEGKGLLILACCAIKIGDITTEVDIPTTKNKMSLFNESAEIEFSVTRKGANDPKRVKFIGVPEKEVTE